MKRKKKFSIPTVYKGQRFRSKLEAAWAEFFDDHGIVWAFEPEGFDINGVRYLPDFYLPELKTLVEVKGILDATDKRKLEAMANVAASKGILLVLAEHPAGERYRLVYPTPHEFEFVKSEGVKPYRHNVDGTVHRRPDIEWLLFDVHLNRCRSCGKWYFMEWEWRFCPACQKFSEKIELHPGSFDVKWSNSDGRPIEISPCEICDSKIRDFL